MPTRDAIVDRYRHSLGTQELGASDTFSDLMRFPLPHPLRIAQPEDLDITGHVMDLGQFFGKVVVGEFDEVFTESRMTHV
jgi:hypothetical protein